MSAALLALGVLLLALAVHPFVTYPLSLRVLARLRPRLVASGRPEGRVAFCVSCFNEERVIRAKIDNILAMRADCPELEVLVYVDGATDRTAEYLREYGEAIRLVVSSERMGKTHGMNRLVGMTGADFCVFSDANVIFAPDALPRLLAGFADPEVSCVCGHLVYTQPEGSATAAAGSLYWRLEEHIKALETASGSVMGADGSIFALRRAMHQAPPSDLIDDMYVSLAALCAGGRIIRVPDAIAYEEAVSRPGEEFRRKVRIACQAFNVHRRLAPLLRQLPVMDQYKYVSHKLLRWLTIYLLGAGAVLVLAGLALSGAWPWALALAVLGAGFIALVAAARGGPLGKIREILSAFAATGLGVWRSLRGDRFQTWNPPASARGVALSGGD